MPEMRTLIMGSGSCIPEVRIPNTHFLSHEFCEPDGKPIAKPTPAILEQFVSITGIHERRHARPDQKASDLCTEAAEKALAQSGLDRETLDLIIVAHNFGDIPDGQHNVDVLPALASRVKHNLAIRNPGTVAFDLVFGCPGWVQAMITASGLIRCGDVRRALVIGTDTLSRVSDPHDRDSLIYADGAGATLLEGREDAAPIGILSHASRSDTLEHSHMLTMGPSYRPEAFKQATFLKMEGRKLYKYALRHVAGAIKLCLDKAGLPLSAMHKLLLHQANEKMDEAILAALYELCGVKEIPVDIMPMTIGWLGNSSVATVPTLYDLLVRGELEGHRVQAGDLLVCASVGAGMNINALTYRMP